MRWLHDVINPKPEPEPEIQTRPPIPEYLRSREGYVWTAEDTEFVLGRMQQITRTWGDIVRGLREGRLK
jgi:hypothetical protein